MISKSLRALRLSRSISTETAAKILNISTEEYRKVERYPERVPMKLLSRVLHVFGATLIETFHFLEATMKKQESYFNKLREEESKAFTIAAPHDTNEAVLKFETSSGSYREEGASDKEMYHDIS